MYVVHAETNAILNAQRSVKGCKLYVTLHPCSRCALMVVAAGIKEVFVQNVRDDEDTKLSKEILLESGIITHIREFV
jgi:dCMP deaminase